MEDSGENNTACGLRRRSLGPGKSENPNLPLNLDVGCSVSDGSVIKGTPSPNRVRMLVDDDDRPSSSIEQFRKKQQSFEIHIEDCDEEELSIDGISDDEGNPPSRPITPANIYQYPDCTGNVVYKEQTPKDDFLRVGERDLECVTDVSEGESENEDENDDGSGLPKNSVIKKVPS